MFPRLTARYALLGLAVHLQKSAGQLDPKGYFKLQLLAIIANISRFVNLLKASISAGVFYLVIDSKHKNHTVKPSWHKITYRLDH
jgi:TctA family transporter